MIAIALDHFQNKKSAEDWEIEKLKRMEAACEMAKAKVDAELEGWSTSEDENAENPPLLSPIVDQNRRKKADTVIKESSKPNAESTSKQGPLRKQARSKNISYIDSGQSDLAVQDDLRVQNPLSRLYDPSQMTSAEKKIDEIKIATAAVIAMTVIVIEAAVTIMIVIMTEGRINVELN